MAANPATFSDVAIVGAGPYGLSVAAHLRARGLTFRIFGRPMVTWREHMPRGMFLKSDGFASNLSDPAAAFTLEAYCAHKGIRYDDVSIPVALETFTGYGAEFQKRVVPEVEEREVTAVEPRHDGFSVRLDDGSTTLARKVVLAVGISHFQYVPPQFSHLPAELLTHSFAHHDLNCFRGRNVIVVGAGASATDLAALLREAGAQVSVVARRSSIRFLSAPQPSSNGSAHQPVSTDGGMKALQRSALWARIRYPESGIGPGWKSRFYANAPWLFHYFPRDVRLRIVREHLGPSASYTVKDRILGHVPLLLGYDTRRVEEVGGKVRLTLVARDQTTRTEIADHVIAATGYKVDIRRLSFLGDDIRARLRTVDHTPELSRNFQASIPGLYFVGLAAANSFGPLLRFVCGTSFAARTVVDHIAKSTPRRVVAPEATLSATP